MSENFRILEKDFQEDIKIFRPRFINANNFLTGIFENLFTISEAKK